MKCIEKLGAVLAGLALCCACAIAGPNVGLMDNPAPAAPFKGYGKYELATLSIAPTYAGQAPNEKAAAKIQSYLDSQVKPVLTAWSTAGEASGAKGTLLFTPVIESIKFVSGAGRFWGGALAGSSFVVLRIKISEQESGKVIAEPEFFQRAAAMSGAWTMGGQDNDMLQRIVTVAASYVSANYETTVGGPTGRASK